MPLILAVGKRIRLQDHLKNATTMYGNIHVGFRRLIESNSSYRPPFVRLLNWSQISRGLGNADEMIRPLMEEL